MSFMTERKTRPKEIMRKSFFLLNNKFWLLITPFFEFFFSFKLNNRERNSLVKISTEYDKNENKCVAVASPCLERTMKLFLCFDTIMIKFFKTKSVGIVWKC